jgi:hypothetical protein
LDDRGIGGRFPSGVRNFSLFHNVQAGSGPQAASYTMHTSTVSLAVKLQEREADHSHSSAKITNGGAIRLFPIRLDGVVLI